MGAATSKDIAFAVLVPLPFDVVSTVIRFSIRLQRRAWGADDWAMVVNIPCWIISVVGLIGMAWNGIGAPDATLTEQQMANSLMWFFVFQEFWCFTLVAIKWSIGITLIRIGNAKRWVQFIIFTCLTIVTITMGGTGMYLFFQCLPVEKNWHNGIPGKCQPRNIQTVLSFLVAGVSITTDWIFATLPIFLLWDIQLDPRVKLSVICLLSLGVFASVAPIVRLKYLLGMNDSSKFIQNLGVILGWAAAEMNVGMLIANLPACRPLLEKFLTRFFSLNGSRNKSSQYPTGSAPGPNRYLELEERGRKKNALGTKHPGVETRIYGRDMEGDSNESLADDASQRRIVGNNNLGVIRVQKEFGTEVSGIQKHNRAME